MNGVDGARARLRVGESKHINTCQTTYIHTVYECVCLCASEIWVRWRECDLWVVQGHGVCVPAVPP